MFFPYSLLQKRFDVDTNCVIGAFPFVGAVEDTRPYDLVFTRYDIAQERLSVFGTDRHKIHAGSAVIIRFQSVIFSYRQIRSQHRTYYA